MIFNILKAITVLVIVSSSFSLLYSNNIISFLKMFFFATVIQFVVYNIFGFIKNIIAEKIKNDRIREFSKQGIETKCPCDRSANMFLPIRLDQPNNFQCLECGKPISVSVDVKTFQGTVPIDLDKSDAELSEIFDKLSNKK